MLTRAFNEMSARLRRNQLALEESRLEVEDANARLIAQNNELQRVNEVFQQLSITDDLTKLHNHRFFHEHLPREMKRAVRTGEPLALIVIDLDDFKRLNDRFGHAVGDAVLHQVAVVMSGVVREMDLLARYGGEEFALLASRTPLDGAVALAEKIRLAISHARFSVMNVRRSDPDPGDGVARRGGLPGRREGLLQRRRPRPLPRQGAGQGLRRRRRRGRLARFEQRGVDPAGGAVGRAHQHPLALGALRQHRRRLPRARPARLPWSKAPRAGSREGP